MSTYFLAPALVTLRDEVDARFPNRDRASDGWIGDPSHAARPSDHNPDWSAGGHFTGIVRAIDIDISPDGRPDLDLRTELLKAAIGDDRVWYVISNGIIYSRTYGWAAHRYTGSNPHDHHVHISLRHFVGEFHTEAWFAPSRPRTKPRPVDVSVVVHQFARALGLEDGRQVATDSVRRVQRTLNRVYGLQLDVDGKVGERTLNAWGRHERATDGRGRPRMPDTSSIARLSRGNFRVVA